MKYYFLLFGFLISFTLSSQNDTWVDTLDHYARTDFLPAKKYRWTWQHAAFLNAVKVQYETASEENKAEYLDYMKKAMNRKLWIANGKSPNAVASGLGMAFLARVTGEKKYQKSANKIFKHYSKIPKTKNGGVSHLKLFRELWDDTIFMVGCYLREMYLFTQEEKYLDELVHQIEVHREALKDDQWGLWYHGWDDDNKNRPNWICGQKGWSKNPEKRSGEIWGRGNGWVVVTLAETVAALPDSLPQRKKLAAYLKEMIVHLPELQDEETGHWYQLPVRKNEEGNYIESSCTAMFGYGISLALKEGVVEGEAYEKAIERAYHGLRKYSIRKEGDTLITLNVCKGTCIGDKYYYFNRSTTSQKSFGIGMFILFGRAYLSN